MIMYSKYAASLLFVSLYSGVLAKEPASQDPVRLISGEGQKELSDTFCCGEKVHAKLHQKKTNQNNFDFPERSSHLSSLKFPNAIQLAEKAPEQKKQNGSPSTLKNGDQKPITPEAETPPELPKPLQPDDTVENVIHYLRLVSDGSNTMGSKDVKSFTALLLKDGRFFENEELAPRIFDPAKRPIGSAGTGRWQRDGEAYALAFSDGTEGSAVSSAALTSPAPPSMILMGLFEETTFTPHQILPHRLNFFKDGSLILERPEQIPQSGHYKIGLRSIDIEYEQGTIQSFLLGVHQPLEKPQLLVIGSKLYQRIEEEE